jgi:hypothetical protein
MWCIAVAVAGALSVTVVHSAAADSTSASQVALSRSNTPADIYTIQADIDGQSELFLSGHSAYWYHLDFAAPGTYNGQHLPTVINGHDWYPTWPAAGYNYNCHCKSTDEFTAVDPPVPPKITSFSYRAVKCRDSCSASYSKGTLVVLFNDDPSSDDTEYEVRISLTPLNSNRTSTVATSLASPRQAFHSVTRTVLNAVVAGGAVLFITFPAQIFNDTLDENYEEILAMWRRFWWRFGGKRRRVRREKRILTAPSEVLSKRREVITFAAVLVAGSVVGGYRDASFGFNLASAANLFGTIFALIALIAAPSIVALIYRRMRRYPDKFVLRAIPAGLAVAILSVLVSRLTHFEPGYLYGLVCGVAFAHKLKEADEGHVVALETLAMLVISGLAWLAFVPVDAAALRPGSGVGLALVDNLLASIVVGGIVGAAISLLPLRFLPGGVLYKWNRAVWAVLIAIPMFGLIAIMLNPSSAPVNNGSSQIVTVVILFLVFGGSSLVFRQFFASRRASDDPESRVTAPTGMGRLG